MLTTGFKLFFGYFLAAATAAVLFGYTTGGNHMGPLSFGWKGSVGDHVGYAVLASVALVSLAVALVLVAFRDADPRAAVELLGTDQVPVQRPAGASYWPLITAFGAGAVLVGLVLNAIVFVAGLLVLFIVAVEWTMQAWADRATGDPEVNRELRNRIMSPIEVPVGAAIAIVLVPLCMSRLFLTVSKESAVWVAIGVAAAVLGIAALLALRPKLSKNLLAGVVLVGGIALIGAGIVSVSLGERTIERHHPTEEHSESTGN
jgi:hypothetical protein